MKKAKHVIEFEKAGELYLFADDDRESDDSIFLYKIKPLAGVFCEECEYESVVAIKNRENICITDIPVGKYEIQRIK